MAKHKLSRSLPERVLLVCGMLLLLSTAAAGAVAAAANSEQAYQKLVLGRQYSKAAALLARWANADDPRSQYRLAVMYRLGQGVKRDDAVARKWLVRAARGGNKDAARMLARLADVVTTEVSADDKQVVRVESRVAVIVPLQTVPARPAGQPAWIAVAASREFENIQGVLAAGTDPDVRDKTGSTALSIATRSGSNATARALISAGADVNLADSRGWTPLMWAARTGNADLIKALLEAKAKIGMSPDAAAHSCSLSAFTLLVGVATKTDSAVHSDLIIPDVVAQCESWPSFIDVLADSKFLTSGSKGVSQALVVAVTQKSVADVDKLLSYAADINSKDAQGYTPLHHAAVRGDADIVSLLLSKGAIAGAPDPHGNTALMLAAERGNGARVARLLQLPADLNQKNAYGETVLFKAVKSGHAATVRLVLDAGASPNLRTLTRDTALKLAQRLKNPDILNQFKN